MELAVLAGLTGVSLYGYLNNQKQREQNFINENSSVLNIPAGYPNVYGPNGQPSIMFGQQMNQDQNQMNQQYQYQDQNNQQYLEHMQRQQQQILRNQYQQQQQQQMSQGQQSMNQREHFTNMSNTNLANPMPPVQPIQFQFQPIQSNQNQYNVPQLGQGSNILKNMVQPHDSSGSNINRLETDYQTTNQYLLNIANRPNADFVHNNMVPFSKKFTQNMGSTGVADGNYIDGVTIDTGNDKSTPSQSKLDMFTGINANYMSKRETGPMFSPAEQQGNYVYGAPLLRPDDERYTVSLTKRNDLAPVQPIQVGPGLNLDPSIPATGGFHDFTRVMPNNVSDYKANQLENRINEGKLNSAGLPTSYPGIGGVLNAQAPGVPKNRAPKDWSQARRPTMTTKVGFVSTVDELRGEWDIDNRPKNGQREQISYGYGSVNVNNNIVNENFVNSSGAAGGNKYNSPNRTQNPSVPCVEFPATIGISPSRPGFNGSNRSPTYMSQDNNIRSVTDCNSQPIGNPAAAVKKTGPMLTNYYVNQTDRGSVNPANVEQLNIKGPNVISGYNYSDQMKTTMKETNQFSYQGDPNQAGKMGKSYTYVDAPKTTMKETNEFSYQGDPNQAGKIGKSYTYVDAPKTTMKETNEFSYQGDPNQAGKMGKSYTYVDGMKSTIKQSTAFSYQGDPNKAGKMGKSYTYVDGMKPTIKQSTNFSYNGIANTGKSKFVETNRFQYTGPDSGPGTGPARKEDFGNIDYNSLKSALSGGANTYTIKGTTLIKDYMPGAGRSNIRQDPDDIMGKYNPGTFGNDSNMNGPGTLAQSLPNGARFQNNRFLAVPTPSPNKLIGMDDRQLASYQTEQLRSNPLSMFTNNPNGEVPNLMADINPTDYSDLITYNANEFDGPAQSPISNKEQINESNLPYAGQNIYPPEGNVANVSRNNPNTNIVFNTQTENDYNPMISQGSSRKVNEPANFKGHAYSGTFNPNVKVQSPSGPIDVYGPASNYRPREQGDVGIENGPINGQVCEQNPAVDYAGGSLMIARDLV